MPVATSTVAFTAYNVLALAGGPRTLEQISLIAPRGVVEHLRAALDEMVRRGWLSSSDAGEYDLRDAKRRLVRARDRSDGVVKSDGSVTGGWGRWVVQCKQRGLLTIEQAIAETESARGAA